MAVAEAAVSIAPAADEKPEGIQWFSMRPKRTQAMPQHTLFGTNMESFDKNSLRDTEARYIPEGYIRPTPNRYPLPDYLQHKLTGREALESSRRDLLRQKNVFSEIDKELRAKAQGALSFKESKQHPSQTARSDRSKRPTWLTEEDLKHSEDINIVGLNARGSYNRDKYGPKPRRHNYSLIGDVMAKNMEFNTPRVGIQDNEEAFRRGKACGWGPGRQLPYELMDDKTKKSKSKSRSLVDLPPNIRHTFGSRVCDSLLSDKELVDRAMERQKVSSGPPRPSKKENVEGLPVDLKGNYESLGQAMRYNVFPGLTTEHTISRTQDDFNDEVHLRRVPNPDEYRYQRDELSTWSEHNVLRERMKKAWNETHPIGGKKP
ncbi:uncharacterized protein LOC101854415 isoform X2 [Aplysia californica]|uniref:Uncharacterized protein LOC101854415 isoform X2 n=1 Tax=Aplysia californica TaxID=6500 RepID=A0ABM0JSU6_APLCA|nr:uncharacterized protein LOC101854415 isoform X2 [Aplysia californica]